MPYPQVDDDRAAAKARIDQLRGPAIMKRVLTWPVLSPPGVPTEDTRQHNKIQMDHLRQMLQLPEPDSTPVQVLGELGSVNQDDVPQPPVQLPFVLGTNG